MAQYSPVQQMIMLSQYAEFPDTVEIIRLCRASARYDGRNVRQALNGCAKHRLQSVESPRLRRTLIQMASSFFPESLIRVIEDENHQMEKKLARRLATPTRTVEEMMDPHSTLAINIDSALGILLECGVQFHEEDRVEAN